MLDNIESSDSELRAAIALVRNDKAATGEMNNFEDAAAFVIPTDPVAKRKQTHKRSEVDVSVAEKEKNKRAKTGEEVDISSTTVPSQRVGKGTTGVEH